MKVINIRESLLQIDRDTDNKYDLTSLYESCKLSEEDKKDLVQMLSGPATPQDIGALINGRCNNCTTAESFMENYPDDLSYDDSYLFADEEDLENGVWIERASKNVMDSDGFTTDYTWYTNKDGKHIFMFGDKEIETPDEDYADWECESEQCAREWFDNYNGFETEDDEPVYPEFDLLDEDDKSHKEETCEKCGTTLNDQGECPYCDLGDEDVLKEEFKPEELTQEILKTVNDFLCNELGYDNEFINDYVFIEISPAELDTIKIEVRAELNYEELTQLGSKLDKVIQAYDSSSYFEPEDAGILVAYVDLESDDGEIDPEVVEEITDMLTSAQSLEELRDIYTKYIVPNRDNWSKKTLDEIYDVLDEVLDKLYKTDSSLDEGPEKKQVKEGFPSNINLDRVVMKVANLLDDSKLGDNWIEVFPIHDSFPIGNGEYGIKLEITGADEKTRKANFRTKNGRVEVSFVNGSEAMCDDEEAIARFIAGEFGLNLNESKSIEKVADEDPISDWLNKHEGSKEDFIKWVKEHPHTYNKLLSVVNLNKEKQSKSMNEDLSNDYIYLFPELTDDDIKMMTAYNIKYLGMNHGPDGSEDNWVAYGRKEDLEKYAEKYLGYELHPDYLYEYDDFAGEIVN